MNSHRFHSAQSAAPWPPRSRHHRHDRLAVGAAMAVLALVAGPALAPPPAPSASAQLQAFVEENAQTLHVPDHVAGQSVARDAYAATPGIASLAASGANHDWARLVMLLGGWPQSENNITVFTRWMRQENGPDDWFNRNNPLNNGWGSGGGGGLGSYDNLVIAAENAAEALHSHPGYASIVAGLASSAPTEVTEAAIWASPWATSHYANGGHWSYAPVPVVKAPAAAWG